MDTIFAPITATVKSSVIVIRISGSKVKESLQYLGVKKIINRRAILSYLKDPKNNEIIDQSLITFFASPNSFTGEDVAEIAIHGSNYILHKIVTILQEIPNVRLADAGEFSKRAFLNNRIDLIEAEAIVDLVASETELQHKQALRQLQGELSKIYDDWREELINIAANLEAFIDFPDEDLPENIINDLEKRVAVLVCQIKNHLNDNQRGEKLNQGLSLAIIGEPNVGKSTLVNYLAKSDIAIVSDIAGTTRDVIDVHLNIAGIPVVISDTAGIRETKNLIEKEGIKRALNKAKMADLKIIILDGSKSNNFIIKELEDLIDKNSIVIFNKVDLLPNSFVPENYQNQKIISALPISLKENFNIDNLFLELKKRVKDLAGSAINPLITRARYRKSLLIAANNLEQFSLDKNIELAAEDLRLAIREIGKINGKVEVDDILDVIFSSFCIGK